MVEVHLEEGEEDLAWAVVGTMIAAEAFVVWTREVFLPVDPRFDLLYDHTSFASLDPIGRSMQG